jgi:hypothetical protein
MVGIVGIYPANSVGDDIEVYTDESRAEVSQRRQMQREGESARWVTMLRSLRVLCRGEPAAGPWHACCLLSAAARQGMLP